MSIINTHTRTRWCFRISGYFWILCGLAWSCSVLINWLSGFGGNDLLRLSIGLAAGLCLVFVGYGLSQERRWGKIGGALLSSLMVLVFCDMVLMFAVHRNILGVSVNFAGIVMSIYTLAVIAFVRK
jgi:hypothetical protein